ncbi:hypothetical protein D8674_013054 [Pyrus ussuriensis x Pyrus communis]|uniref:Uncharacterized protein n=1 Tax=Pyrus ussuriensis x Pyrus communis TaxID=2448454 RepID=A0A5N5GNN3_9ROSA|nr:hypothetical protein D8674_013054 [Pyrus ussuriensis x Pyrus communis]
MADSGEGSCGRRVQVPYFEDKSMAEAYAKLIYDIGGLVRRECSAEFESWKKVSEELKKSMLGELLRFRQWKFDVMWDAERGAAAPEEED